MGQSGAEGTRGSSQTASSPGCLAPSWAHKQPGWPAARWARRERRAPSALPNRTLKVNSTAEGERLLRRTAKSEGQGPEKTIFLWLSGREVGEATRKTSGRKRKGVCKILKRKKQLNLAEGSVKVKSTKDSNKPQAGAATHPGWAMGDCAGVAVTGGWSRTWLCRSRGV